MPFTINTLKTGMVAVAIFTMAGCKNNADIPLPEEANGYAAPVTYPIKFEAPKPIVWEENPATYTPQISSFNYGQLPSSVFDSSDFKPLKIPAVETSFDFNKLESSPFYYDSLPGVPLRFETGLLGQPTIVEADKHKQQPGTGQVVFDFGHPLDVGYGTSILKTRDGRIWSYVIGKGLCCYDGQTVSMYKIAKVSSAAMAMVEDNNGQLWFTTANDGIFSVNLSTGIVRQITLEKGLPANFSYNLTVDKNNRVWIAFIPQQKTQKGGIAIIDEQRKELKVINNYQGMMKIWALSVMQDNAGNIWMLSDSNTVHIIDLQQNKIKRLNDILSFPGDTLTQIKQDHLNRIWLAGLHSINVLDMAKGTCYHIDQHQFTKREFVAALVEDRDGNMWVGGKYNLNIFAGNLRQAKTLMRSTAAKAMDYSRITEDNNNQMAFVSADGLMLANAGGYKVKHIGQQGVSCLAEDSRGRIWEGSLTTGILIIDTATGMAKTFNHSNGLRNDSIQCLLADGEQMIIGTRSSLQVIDSSLKTTEIIEAAQGLSIRNIATVAKDHNHNIWVGGITDHGIDVVNLRKKTITHLGSKQGLADVSVLDIKEGKDGQMWFSTRTGSIGIIDLQKKTVQYVAKQNPIVKNEQPAYRWLASDKLGNTWVGTPDGLYAINAARDSVSYFSTNQGLLANYIISVKEYQGRIYAGCGKGLNIITPPNLSASKKWEVTGVGEIHGVSKTINSINSDLITRGGQYWWGDMGNTIITNLDEQLKSIYIPPTITTGLVVFNKRLHFTDNPWPSLPGKDTIWDRANENAFYTDGKILPKDSMLTGMGLQWDSIGSYNMPVNLKLPHDKNYLQFYFSQAHMGSNDSVWYRYILQGVDKQWSPETTETESDNYMNLAPGAYTFKVSTWAASGWQKPTEFSFIILAPWWKSWWAYCLYVGLFILIVWRFIQYRSLQLKKDNQRLEEMVRQRTNELSQSITELKATQSQLIQSEKMASLGELTAGIAHEIQNPLNFVNNFSEVSKELLEEMKEEMDNGNMEDAKDIANDVIQNLEKINHHGKRADGIVKGMLQHSRNNSGQKEPTDINKLADEYLRLAYHGLRAKDKTFNATLKTDFDESIGTIKIVPQDIGRVILNLITNAFYSVNEKKKSPQPLKGSETYEPTVTVTTKRLVTPSGDGGIAITIKDNGTGIPQKVLDKIFQPFFTTKPTGQGTGLGLSMSYDIITKGHGGTLKANTSEGQGAEFIITLPA